MKYIQVSLIELLCKRASLRIVRWQQNRIIASNSNLVNCRPQNAWECLSSANKEQNFAQMFEVIHRTEQFCAQKFDVNFRSKRIVIWKFTQLETIGIANYRDFLSKMQYFFVEKPRKATNFGEIHLHYFCTILYMKNTKVAARIHDNIRKWCDTSVSVDVCFLLYTFNVD